MKKKNSTPTPHDATFRHVLSHPDVARDFMQIHLPAELLAVCDLALSAHWHSAYRNRRTH